MSLQDRAEATLRAALGGDGLPSVAQMKVRANDGHHRALHKIRNGDSLQAGPEVSTGGLLGMRTVMSTLSRWGCFEVVDGEHRLTDRGEALLDALGPWPKRYSSKLGGWDPANTVMAKGPYYHGTNATLSPGDEIHSAGFSGLPGHSGEGFEHYDPYLVYLTNNPGMAYRFAQGAVRRQGGTEHVYEVRPIGTLMPDPEYEASGWGSDQVAANMAEVIRELSPAEWSGRRAKTSAQISNQTPEQISTGWAFGGKIIATEAGQKVGVLEYSIMPGGKVHLDWIHVDPAARHGGIAMQMLEAAQAVVPDKPLSFGLTTADGLKLRWAWEEQHGSTVGAKTAADVSDEPRDESGRWTREAIDKRLEEQLGKPEKLAADKVKHPRSGFDVEVGEDKHVHHPKEWGGPAVLDVDDYGPMPGTPEQDEWRRKHKVFNYRKNVRQDPIKDLYRAMSVDEWKWVQEHGYISSDKRGVIDDKEGTNAGIDRETAWSYLPRGQYGDTGVIARIRFDPADGWFTIPHDDYLRTGQHIPIDRIMAVTTPITHGGKYGDDVVKWEDPPGQAKTATRAYHYTDRPDLVRANGIQPHPLAAEKRGPFVHAWDQPKWDQLPGYTRVEFEYGPEDLVKHYSNGELKLHPIPASQVVGIAKTATVMSLEEAERTFGTLDQLPERTSAWLTPDGKFIPIRYHYNVDPDAGPDSTSQFKERTGSVRINAMTFNLTFDWSGRLTRAQLDKLVELGTNRLVTIDDGRTYRDLDAMSGPALRRVLQDPAGYQGPSLSQQFHTVGAKTAIDESRLGYCYLNAGRYAMDHPDWTLVHGHIGPPAADPGARGVDHAWVESPDGSEVYEPTLDQVFPRAYFEHLFKPTEHERYSGSDAASYLLRHEHWGPWTGSWRQASAWRTSAGDWRTLLERGGFVHSPDECFLNATEAESILGPGYRYTEGYARAPDTNGEWVAHAWVTGPSGEVIDPTWTDSGPGFEYREQRLDFRRGGRTAARWTFDVDYSESKDTLKAGEVVSGTRRITVDAPGETEARLMVEQQVASMGLVPNRWGWSHNGNEPTGVRLVDVEGWEE